MKNKQCLYCYEPLTENENDFHVKCCRQFFGRDTQPEIKIDKATLDELAQDVILNRIAIPGVQPKLSMSFESDSSNDNNADRKTIFGVLGNYILKPQTTEYLSLPENEDLTMHLAGLFGIKTAEHSLARLTSGELAYITKRFDRIDGKKLKCEDLCQLSELLTERKDKSSMEKAGRLIKKYTSSPLLETIYFYELSLFSFLVGNGDMHLKNFSILLTPDSKYILAPAYDLVSSRIAILLEPEEMTLTVNARKNKITKKDFAVFAKAIGMNEKQTENTFNKFSKKINEAINFIEKSFLSTDLKKQYKDLVNFRAERLDLN